MSKTHKQNSNYEAYKSVRKSWGSMNPTERVVPAKGKNAYKRKDKYKKDWRDY